VFARVSSRARVREGWGGRREQGKQASISIRVMYECILHVCVRACARILFDVGSEFTCVCMSALSLYFLACACVVLRVGMGVDGQTTPSMAESMYTAAAKAMGNGGITIFADALPLRSFIRKEANALLFLPAPELVSDRSLGDLANTGTSRG
jgi:hypothetical protein